MLIGSVNVIISIDIVSPETQHDRLWISTAWIGWNLPNVGSFSAEILRFGAPDSGQHLIFMYGFYYHFNNLRFKDSHKQQCFINTCLFQVSTRTTREGRVKEDQGLRPISLLNLSLLRLLDPNFPGDSLWAWGFHPSRLRFCLSQTLEHPQC